VLRPGFGLFFCDSGRPYYCLIRNKATIAASGGGRRVRSAIETSYFERRLELAEGSMPSHNAAGVAAPCGVIFQP
jgi:hypothetical protein